LRMSHIDFMDDTNTVMRHKFLKNWNDDRDALVYPPSSGRYSVYTGADIVDQFAFVVYYSIQDDSFASFSYDTLKDQGIRTPVSIDDPRLQKTWHIAVDDIPPMEFCINRIANVTVYNNTYEFDVTEIHDCVLLKFTEKEVKEIRKNSSVLRELLKERHITFRPEDALIISKGILKFSLRTIHFSPVSTDQRPECYRIDVSVIFDNSRHTGQVYIYLSTVISYVTLCSGRVLHGGGIFLVSIIIFIIDMLVLLMCIASFVLCCRALLRAHLLKLVSFSLTSFSGGGVFLVSIIIFIIDMLVLLMCIASFILCCRALLRAHLLKLVTMEFVETVLKRKLSLSDRLEFLNLWYLMIVTNDIFIILGTLCKITIEFRFK
uniref:PKD_channel domain-containing protein n=1 Tax=Gongylonema pulchrum TaxID=637853 RepID=A0A183EFS3_9BILA